MFHHRLGICDVLRNSLSRNSSESRILKGDESITINEIFLDVLAYISFQTLFMREQSRKPSSGPLMYIHLTKGVMGFGVRSSIFFEFFLRSSKCI
jgi:hypothetical protein